jgi:tryptophan-rich hypothetical protein
MTRINTRKLLHSKWTAVVPRAREKHFIVVRVLPDLSEIPDACILESVHSKNEYEVGVDQLADNSYWCVGWN